MAFDHEKALEDWQKVLSISESPPVLKAYAYLRVGKIKESEEELLRANIKNDSSPAKELGESIFYDKRGPDISWLDP
ncbi:MAG: hypothetical protein K8F91_17775 [Candidatus Obscuribacterales bacterium]|nr:hypothetical protein [Candidatus Obscuribacterales bacterium]